MALSAPSGGPLGLLACAIVTALAGFVVGRRRRRPATHPATPAVAELAARLTVTQRLLDDTQERLRHADDDGERLRRELSGAQAEVLRISGRAKVMTDRGEAEMGRLESAAILALEHAAAAHRGEVAELKERLARAQDAEQALRADVDGERRRAAQLEAALTQRDRALSALRAGTPPRRSGRAPD